MEKPQAFKKIFVENDLYRSPEKERSSIFPGINFYFKFVKVIIKSGNLAKKGKYGPVEWVNSSLDIFQALEESGIKFDITGMNNLHSSKEPVVFISNHMSTLETMILPSIIQPAMEVTFIVKQELLDFPYFGNVLGARNPIVVGRTNPREDLMHVMNEGVKYLTNGRSIIVFPQKTRSNIFNPESFNTLGIKLAKKAGVKIIPIALVTDAWGNGKIMKEFGKINPTKKVFFKIGEPIKVESSGTTEHNYILEFIKDNLIKWGREDCIIL